MYEKVSALSTSEGQKCLREDGVFLETYSARRGPEPASEASVDHLQEMARIRLCLNRASDFLSGLQEGSGRSSSAPLSTPGLETSFCGNSGSRAIPVCPVSPSFWVGHDTVSSGRQGPCCSRLAPGPGRVSSEDSGPPGPHACLAVLCRGGRGQAALPSARGTLLQAGQERLVPGVPGAETRQRAGDRVRAAPLQAGPPGAVGVSPGGLSAAGEWRGLPSWPRPPTPAGPAWSPVPPCSQPAQARGGVEAARPGGQVGACASGLSPPCTKSLFGPRL